MQVEALQLMLDYSPSQISHFVFGLRRPGCTRLIIQMAFPSRPRDIHLITCILLCFCSYFILAHRWLVSRRSCRALTCRLVCRNVPPLPAALPAPARTGWRRGTWDMSRSPPATHQHTAQHTQTTNTRSVSSWTHRKQLSAQTAPLIQLQLQVTHSRPYTPFPRAPVVPACGSSGSRAAGGSRRRRCTR